LFLKNKFVVFIFTLLMASLAGQREAERLLGCL
jgi:hypothetical protein